MDSDQSLAKVAQHLMVENQLRANRVSDPRLVEAFAKVPRHLFAAHIFTKEQNENLAYADKSIALGAGRWLLEPRVLGRLLQAAEIGANDAVLDICCATGYTTALAAHLAALAVGVDGVSSQVATAEENLHHLGLSSGLVLAGDPRQGAESYAPYDVILIGGAVDFVPQSLLQQLAEGGRLVTVLRAPNGQSLNATVSATARVGASVSVGASSGAGAGSRVGVQATRQTEAQGAEVSPSVATQNGCGVLYRRVGAQFPHRKLFDANVPALAEFIRAPEFVF